MKKALLSMGIWVFFTIFAIFKENWWMAGFGVAVVAVAALIVNGELKRQQKPFVIADDPTEALMWALRLGYRTDGYTWIDGRRWRHFQIDPNRFYIICPNNDYSSEHELNRNDRYLGTVFIIEKAGADYIHADSEYMGKVDSSWAKIGY